VNSNEAYAAVSEGMVGNEVLAMQEAQAALAFAKGKDAIAMSAIALGLAGDTTQTERLAHDLSKHFPGDTIVEYSYLPMIHAAIRLWINDPGKAVEALAVTAPYEWGLNTHLYPVYWRGQEDARSFLSAR
jgi:hypothetical protein